MRCNCRWWKTVKPVERFCHSFIDIAARFATRAKLLSEISLCDVVCKASRFNESLMTFQTYNSANIFFVVRLKLLWTDDVGCFQAVQTRKSMIVRIMGCVAAFFSGSDGLVLIPFIFMISSINWVLKNYCWAELDNRNQTNSAHKALKLHDISSNSNLTNFDWITLSSSKASLAEIFNTSLLQDYDLIIIGSINISIKSSSLGLASVIIIKCGASIYSAQSHAYKHWVDKLVSLEWDRYRTWKFSMVSFQCREIERERYLIGNQSWISFESIILSTLTKS